MLISFVELVLSITDRPQEKTVIDQGSPLNFKSTHSRHMIHKATINRFICLFKLQLNTKHSFSIICVESRTSFTTITPSTRRVPWMKAYCIRDMATTMLSWYRFNYFNIHKYLWQNYYILDLFSIKNFF